MGEEFFWIALGWAVIFAAAVLWLQRKKAREAQALRIREMLHQERLTAIKEGVPLPEIPDLDGIGICAAFYWAPDRGFHSMWTIGFIPILAGFGFLLYFALAPRSDR